MKQVSTRIKQVSTRINTMLSAVITMPNLWAAESTTKQNTHLFYITAYRKLLMDLFHIFGRPAKQYNDIHNDEFIIFQIRTLTLDNVTHIFPQCHMKGCVEYRYQQSNGVKCSHNRS